MDTISPGVALVTGTSSASVPLPPKPCGMRAFECSEPAAAPATSERVLDLGCGAGASSLALAALVGRRGQVLGVDIPNR